jgi:hypothetical protein
MLAALSAIEKTKQNLKFVRQRLGTIKLWAKVLSLKEHAARGEDAHWLLLLSLVTDFRKGLRANQWAIGTFPYKK